MKSLYINFYVNIWKVIMVTMVALQIYLGFEPSGFDWSNISGAIMIWALYMVGYNALDRELEIKLDQARKAMTHD